MNDSSKALGTAPILTLLARYSIPSVLAMLAQVLYTFVDAIFIGHFVGEKGLAAISLVFPLVVFSSGFGMLVGIGSCSYISILLGQRRLDEAEKTLGNAFCMIFLFYFVMLCLIMIPGTLFVEHSAVSPEVQQMAKTFLWISIGCGVFPSLMFGLNNIIRVQGNPKIAMCSIMLGFLLNSVFNPIFIALFNLGVAGSALATALAQSITTVWILCFLTSSRSLLKLRLKNMRLDWKICAPVLSIGTAPFLAQCASSLQGLFLNIQLAHYGQEAALTVSGINYRIALVVFTVVIGIFQGAQPILGFNFGARQFDRVLKAWKLAILIATIWCFSTISIVIIFPLKSLAFFTQLTPELEAIGSLALRASLCMGLLMGFQVIVSQAFLTIGKPVLSTILSLSRQVLFMIPALFILPKLFPLFGWDPLNGVWCSYTLADLLAFILTLCFFLRESRILRSGQVSSNHLKPSVSITDPPANASP